MPLTLEIPDELASRFEAASEDLSRRALELLALQEYRKGHLTETDLQRLLGFGTRYKLDGFLKAHGILIEDYTVDELRHEVETLQRLGF